MAIFLKINYAALFLSIIPTITHSMPTTIKATASHIGTVKIAGNKASIPRIAKIIPTIMSTVLLIIPPRSQDNNKYNLKVCIKIFQEKNRFL